ncbi:MAG: molybdopterin-dependent oxidoreductase [Xanthobacteraceae bacterium]|nr:molybdopterin-dependent oxidoreductase [Xanthobacteraceae bacterium]QYK45648.1 MAG: molybdopterin-dependent oxidoreductase [Xanthobacteraceae bacterium]
MKQHSEVIGRRIPQIEGQTKVNGEAEYTHDVTLPGMLYCAILRSPHAAADILEINLKPAMAVPGIVDAVVSSDFSGERYVNYGAGYSDRYPLATGKVRFYGEEVAAVAAETAQSAWLGVRAISVKYREQTPAVTTEAALASGAIEIHPRKEKLPANVAQAVDVKLGDVDAGFEEAALVVEGHYEHGVVWPVCMETNAAVASFDKTSGKLEVWCGTQAPFFVRKELARVLKLELANIIVRPVAIGGGFGGKSQSPEQIAIAALLSKRTGRPIKIALSRDEEYIAGKSDHAKSMSLRTAVDRSGNILARTVDAIVDNGAYTHMGPVYVSALRQRIANLYRVGAAGVRAKLVYTNKLPGGSYRGMGAPGIIWAIESQIDELAEQLNIDPVAYRIQIANQPGDITPLGWKITSCGLSDCLRKASERIGWTEKRGKLPPFRGIGIASMIHPSGSVLYAEGNFSNLAVELDGEGHLTIFTQTADAGTWQNTILAQLVAETLGISTDNMSVVHMDTEHAPDDLGSAASRVTFVTGNAAIAAGKELISKIRTRLSQEWNVETEKIEYRVGAFVHPDDARRELTLSQAAQRFGSLRVEGHYSIGLERPDPVTGYGNYAASYAFGAQAVEVEVDPGTGHVTILNIASAQDVGRVLNPTALEGQTYGGIMQGVGMALSEDVVFENGRPVNRSLINYRVPRIADTPNIFIDFIETNEALGPFGAKAAGEPTINATVAAVANAVADAVGVRFYKLPITPERVLAAIEAKKKRELALKPYLRPFNAEVAAVRKIYPVMFPVMKKAGKHLAKVRPQVRKFETSVVDTIEEAILEASSDNSRFLGGGTDLLPGIRQGVYGPEKLISYSNIPGVKEISEDEHFVSVGAAVTLDQLVNDKLIGKKFPGLASGTSLIATQQIRNRATVAGDLCQEKRCWFFRSATPCYRFSGPACPCYAVLGDSRHHSILGAGRCAAPCVADLAPMLSCLGAEAVTAGPEMARRIPVEQLYVWAGETVLEPGELITRIDIPQPSENSSFHYEKYARWRGDFAEASAAVRLIGTKARLIDAAILMGGVAPMPARAVHSEEVLRGVSLTPEAIESAASASVFGALPMKDNRYKAALTVSIVSRAITVAAERLPPA